MDKHDPRRAPSEAELRDVQDNWVDEYAPNDKHEADFFYGRTNQVTVAKKKKHKKWPWLLGLLFILAGTGATYALLYPKQTSAPAPKTSPVRKSDQANIQKTAQAKPYTSATYGLTFDIPADWTITDSKDSTDPLIFTSPETTISQTPDSPRKAHMRITVTNKQSTIPAFKGDPATAILDSEKMTYAEPSQNQRAQTYLTYLAYGLTDGGLDAAYVTGDNGYQIGQAVPESDITKSDPLITVTFITCGKPDCSAQVTPINVNPEKFKSSELHTELVKLLSSLQIS